MSDTNAGPVLPAPGYLIAPNQYLEESCERYGLQCWNACHDQVAGPLRERVAELERELGEFRYGAGACAVALAEATAELDSLRAESTIEWEPGRSYTAAELLRRAIRGLRVRKDSDLWPAVRNMCGVGSGVAHFLCRWAGRDPDTGATIEGTK